jgi:hypothetical protein
MKIIRGTRFFVFYLGGDNYLLNPGGTTGNFYLVPYDNLQEIIWDEIFYFIDK